MDFDVYTTRCRTKVCCATYRKMNQRDSDPYEDVALIFAGFICDQCGEALMEHPSMPYAPGDEWERAMAVLAKQRGWYAHWAANDDSTVYCPVCSKKSDLKTHPS